VDPDSLAAVVRAHHGGATDGDVVDFSANTNPRTPPGTDAAYRAALEPSRRYPDDGYPDFREAAAAVVDCDPGTVVPTAGGLAAIRLAVATHVGPGESVLVPAPSFAEYAREVRLQGGTPVFRDPGDVVTADPDEHAMAILCNPNNPTGLSYPASDLRSFAARCREADTAFLVDEAFLGYTDDPSMAGAPGVIVARSLTKLYGLPGIRVGYAVATGEAGERLATARPPWALSAPGAAVGTHCLGKPAFVRETRARVREERARLHEALSTRYEPGPSEAPFLLVDVAPEDPATICERTREAGVVVRDATTFRGLDSHVRVAVKGPAANDRLLEALDV
jgi:histidinol-phosphate aminotransferase/threonine-phosphate decarboxylase